MTNIIMKKTLYEKFVKEVKKKYPQKAFGFFFGTPK